MTPDLRMAAAAARSRTRAPSLRRDPDDPAVRQALAALARGCDFVFPSRFRKRLRDFRRVRGDAAGSRGHGGVTGGLRRRRGGGLREVTASAYGGRGAPEIPRVQGSLAHTSECDPEEGHAGSRSQPPLPRSSCRAQV